MALNDADRSFITQLDNGVEQRVKLWIIRATLAQVVAMVPVIFFLGGIYTDGRAAVDILREQQAELRQRGVWMQDRERWEMAMEMWAEERGFKPPKYSRPKKGEGND